MLIAACCLTALSDIAQASGVVTECNQASLEAAISGGGSVTFACDGVIVLTNTIVVAADATLDASGRDVTISGNNAVRMFNVQSNVTLNLINLSIVGGFHSGAASETEGLPGQGGGIFNAGGTVSALGCFFQTNRAVGGKGGYQFKGGDGFGGAIYNNQGALRVTNCTFSANEVLGTAANTGPVGLGKAGDGQGGAIHNEGGSLVAVSTTFFENSATGADTFGGTGPAGSAWGGGVSSVRTSNLFIDCEFQGNVASAGHPDPGPPALGGTVGGGAIFVDSGVVTAISSRFISNSVTGAINNGFNGDATDGNGGGIFNNGVLNIVSCYFTANHAAGGYDGTHPVSRAGNGGAIYNLSIADILNTTFWLNTSRGGQGYVDASARNSTGGSGNGGAIYTQGALTMTNCTLLANSAEGGSGQFTGLSTFAPGGPGMGGGLCVQAGSVVLQNVTFAGNSAVGGKDTTVAANQGGAIFVSTNSIVSLNNTILAYSPSGGNCYGIVTDAGHNISSDGTAGFSDSRSRNDTDPVLGPLGDYGGGQLTLPLLAGSPAIDAGDSNSCPPTDQRGIARPYGGGCDIGAFESAPPYRVAGTFGGNADPAAITISIANVSTNVGPSGHYKIDGLSPGQFVLTPGAPATRFTPSTRTITLGPDILDAGFRAYRLNSVAAESLTNRLIRIVYAGDPGVSYVLERSTNLFDWLPDATNNADTNGLIEMIESSVGASMPQFFRARKP